MKVNRSKSVDVKALDAEYQKLTHDNTERSTELESLRDELKQLRSIRYYLSRVIPEEEEPEKVSVVDRMTDGRLALAESKSSIVEAKSLPPTVSGQNVPLRNENQSRKTDPGPTF